MNSKYPRLSAIAVLLLSLFGYLAVLNFHLPFMTADELRYILSAPNEVADYALVSGRYSSLIMIPFAEILSFIAPTNISLVPRFISMLLLAAGIFALLKNQGFSNLRALLLVDLILMAHEIDWQHNGLVSFFGIYNVLLAAFIWALLLEEKAPPKGWVFILVFVLLVGAYASELFIGLSLCYLLLKAAINRQAKFILRSPFFWSLVFYVLAYVLIKLTTALAHWNAQEMTTYLVGAVGVYGFDQMLSAALLYFINSLPYYHLLGVSASVSVVISGLLLICIGGYFIKLWFGVRKVGKTNTEIAVAEKNWLLAAMFFLLAVAPNFLLALQPMKVDWILRNASVHYVFSYYTWIGLTVVCTYFAKQKAAVAGDTVFEKFFSPKFLLALVAVAVASASASATQNIKFVNEYNESRGKWVQLNEILKQNKSKEVVISPKYFQHPYISSVTPEQMKTFAKQYYDVRLLICTIDNEIKLNEELSNKFVQLEGFSVIESDGRWTEGAIAKFILAEEDPKVNFVELDVSSVFDENKNAQVIVTKGEKKFRFEISGIGKYRFDIPEGIKGKISIQFEINKPISPFALGLGSDTRNLGIMLRNVRLGFKDSNRVEKLRVMEMCY